MYIYGMMAVVYALKRDLEMTSNCIDENSKDKIAENFSREYFNKFGHHVIPTEEEADMPNVQTLMKTGKIDNEPKETNRLELSGSDKKS